MHHKLFTVMVGVTFLCGVAAAEKVPNKRPNVVYVVADMERAYSMGCYGDSNAKTPTFDKFASQGLRLDACISTTPVCCPYRASLMSGQYAHHNGMQSNGCDFKPTVKCLGETFNEAGYEMGYLGKWHLGPANKKSDPTWGSSSAHRIRHLPFQARPGTDDRCGVEVHQRKEQRDRALDAVCFVDLATFPLQSAEGTPEGF